MPQFSLNKATLIGRVGSEVKVNTLKNGAKVANFSLATNEFWVKDGKKNERVDWHRIVAWRNLADDVEKWISKGSLVYVEGKVRNNKYKDKNGVEKTSTDIEISRFIPLDGKKKDFPEPEENVPSIDIDDEDLPF